MTPSTPAAIALRPPVMVRAVALVVIASILMATTMITIAPTAVRATEPAPDNCGFRPIDLVFIIDRSGSMDTDSSGNSRMEWAQIAAKQLVDGLDAAGGVGTGGIHQVGLASFGDGNEAGTDLALGGSSAADVKAAIDGIGSPDGGTPFNLGMAAGLGTMTAGARGTVDGVDVKQAYVFLSDGNPDPNSYTPSDAEKAAYLAAADVAYAVAIGPDGGDLGGGGTGVSYSLMMTIATPGHFRFVVDADDLPALFTDIGEELNCPVGALEVRKSVSPTDDPGRFNLLINGAVAGSGGHVGHGGTTGEQSLDAGTYTVGESAGTDTSLSDYATGIECKAGDGTGATVASSANAGPLDVAVGDGDDIVCTITNTRSSGTLTVTKVVTNDDGGTADCSAFSFSVNGGTPVAFEAPGCSTVLTLPTGSYTIVEPAVAGYDTTYDNCSQVAVTNGQNATCTITNDDEAAVLVQQVGIEKTNAAGEPVTPGTAVDFTLALTVMNGPIDEVTIVDQLPEGLGDVTLISDGGTWDSTMNRITWNLSDVTDGETLTYTATISADGTAGLYRNIATITDGPCADDCEDDSIVTVRVPLLTIEKSASADTITISGPADDPVASPSVVTWTLTYTLTDGPVTNVVIADEVPAGFVFLDAANGGSFADGTVTWNLGTLSESGSVSFRTTVDPEAISRTAPTVNTAVIDSDQTSPDEGTDSVAVAVEPPPLGGNPTSTPPPSPRPSPRPALPNTALGIGLDGVPVTAPVELMVALAVVSLGALAFANVRASRRRS